MEKGAAVRLLLLIACGIYSHVYSMQEPRAYQQGLTEDQITEKLSSYYWWSSYDQSYSHDLQGVPHNEIVSRRLGTIDEELRAGRYTCCNYICCNCTKKRSNYTLLQSLFENWLLPDGRVEPEKLADLLQYDFDLDELFYACSCGSLQISVLHAAAMVDDADVVEMVLKKQAEQGTLNVDIEDSEGLTPLQRVIIKNNALWCCKIEPRFGFHLQLASAQRGRIIENNWCCSCKMNTKQIFDHAEHIKIVRLLLAAGANPDVEFTTGRLCKKRVSAAEYARNSDMQELLKRSEEWRQ